MNESPVNIDIFKKKLYVELRFFSLLNKNSKIPYYIWIRIFLTPNQTTMLKLKFENSFTP